MTFVKSIICIFAAISIASPNVWDNILSQTESSTPIVPEESFNFDFEIKEYKAKGNFDFSNSLKLTTLTFTKDIIISDLQVFKAQLNLENLILTTTQPLTGCDRYQLDLATLQATKQTTQTKASTQTSGLSNQKSSFAVDSSTLFLMNILFRFVGTAELKEKGLFTKTTTYNVFEFSPNLNGNQQPYLSQLLSKNALSENGKTSEEQSSVKDFSFEQLKFVLLCDRQSGQIRKAFRDQTLKEELTLNLSSKQKGPIRCDKPIKKVTREFLEELFKDAYDNREIYTDLIEDANKI